MSTSDITIQVYDARYGEDVRNICLLGATGMFALQPFKSALTDVFCDYYIREEPENCFIAVENEKAVGYILCSSDYQKWSETFRKNYLKKSQNPVTKVMGDATIQSLEEFSTDYPAHLHIDLDETHRGMKLGPKLLDALCAHLREEGVPGIELGVSTDNQGAIRFYERYGFTKLKENKNEITMGLKLICSLYERQ